MKGKQENIFENELKNVFHIVVNVLKTRKEDGKPKIKYIYSVVKSLSFHKTITV